MKFFLLQIYTPTLDPSLIGFKTTGNLNFLSIFFIVLLILKLFLKENLIYGGVKILFLIKIFFEISLSIASEDDKTPEWEYFTFSDSSID